MLSSWKGRLVERLPNGAVGRELSASSVGTLVFRGISISLGLLSTVLLAHLLGADGLGVYVWATAWAAVLQLVAVVGFDRLAIREIGAARGRNDLSLAEGVLAHGRRVVLASSSGVAAVAAIIGALLLEGDQRLGFLVAVAAVPILALSTFRLSVAAGLGEVLKGRFPEEVVRPAVVTALIAAVTLSGIELSSPWAIVLQDGAILAAFLFGNRILRQILPRELAAGRQRTGTAGPWLRRAAPLGLVGGGEIVLAQAGILLLGVMSNNPEVALFAVATRIATLVGLPEYAINTASMPVIAKLYAEGDAARLRKTASMVSLGAATLGVLSAAPVLAFPGPVLALFGLESDSGATVLRLLCASWIVSGIAGANGSLLMMSGKSRPVVTGIFVALSVNLLLLALLIPTHDAVGAAWAWFATTVVWNAFLALQTRVHLGFWATALALLRPNFR